MISFKTGLLLSLFVVPLSMAYAETPDALLLQAKNNFESECKRSGPGSRHFFDCTCLAQKYMELPENDPNRKAAPRKDRLYQKLSGDFRKRYGDKALQAIEEACDHNANRQNMKNRIKEISREFNAPSMKVRQLCGKKRKSTMAAQQVAFKPVPYDLAMTRFSVKNICINPHLIEQHALTHCRGDYDRKKQQNPAWATTHSEESYCNCYVKYYKNNIKRGGYSSKLQVRHHSGAMLNCSR